MAFNILGGGEIDGRLGENPDFSQYSGKLDYIYTSTDSTGELKFWIVQETQGLGGQLMANGLYANPIVISSDVVIPQATTTVSGIVRKATQADAINGVTDKFLDAEVARVELDKAATAPDVASGSTTEDPNETIKNIILTNHANSPDPNILWYIKTDFWNGVGTGNNRVQTAKSYLGDYPRTALRHRFSGIWTDWAEIYSSSNLVHAQNTSGVTIGDNGTLSGSSLNPAQSGTWRNFSGNDILNNGFGPWVRV
jgi:hypothetical protein